MKCAWRLRVWLALVALATLATICVCIPGFAAAPVEIVWSFWGDPGELPPNYEVIKAFAATHPNIKIVVQHSPWSSYFDKIQTQMAGQTAPDVMFLNNIPSYASRGVLENLDPYIKESGFDISGFYPELMRTFMYRGHVYGFPRDNDTTVLYYNKSLFDAAGVKYPDETWRWNDFLEAAKKLTKTDARGRVIQYGVALEFNKYPLFVYQNGGSVVDDPLEPTKFLLNEPKAAEGIQFMADLINVHKVAPSFVDMKQMGDTTQLFLTGRVAMVMTNAARIPTFKDANFAWDVAPLPAGPTGIRANSMGGAGYVMSSTSKHKKEAWEFLKFLCGREGQTIFASTGVAVPAYRCPETAAAFLADKTPAHKDVFPKETEQGRLFPFFSGWAEISTVLVDPTLDRVFIGETSAKTALNEIADKVQKMIDSRK